MITKEEMHWWLNKFSQLIPYRIMESNEENIHVDITNWNVGNGFSGQYYPLWFLASLRIQVPLIRRLYSQARFWANFDPNIIHSSFWPDFHTNTVNSGLWPYCLIFILLLHTSRFLSHFYLNTMHSSSWPNFVHTTKHCKFLASFLS